ncbi:seryl-tRNA synthetase [Friedmanniella luteola]|uniref:Serine--tRNA ligase n=1 Tax=Friedmanniella luteola TaxID=546871 RepID=A0A1H1L3A4_9ACTN|nr:serine--tRNA ligase [Friedmanniella luteola]SDR68867.1 seryl-tRNA synthetase [Friedmanniella luteola]
MIDVKVLRTDPDRVRASQRARGESVALVDELLAADAARRSAISRYEELRAEQKGLGKQVARAAGDERAALLSRTRELAEEVRKAEASSGEASVAFDALLKQVGNLVFPDVPEGGEDDYVVLETHGERRDFAAEGFTPRDHLELGQLLGAIDVERGAKVSGSRFYYLTGQGAELEFALMNLAMSLALANGFTPMIPPALVKASAMEGTGFLGQAAQDVYHLPDDDLYLVGTAEVPLAAYHSDEVLDASTLPLRYAGFSPSYRREAGSYGKDTRGIFRVHWFDKVEMFVFCAPEDAEAEHQRLLGWEKEFIEALEIPYQVLELAGGDLGLSAARKYDCYGWLPTQDRYREITSTSNCTEFQARRLNVRTRSDGGTGPVATLNGTLCAMTRTIIMILENHQQADGSVRLPAALRPFLGGRAALVPRG